jgi:hypothetical protein
MKPKLALKEIPDDSSVIEAVEKALHEYKSRKCLIEIPVSLYKNRKMGVLEITVKYMKENCMLSFAQIAALLNRDQRTVWTAYRKAALKHPKKLSGAGLGVPYTIFTDRSVGPLESLIGFLKGSADYTYKEISTMLGRSYSTVWLTYHNGFKKRVR